MSYYARAAYPPHPGQDYLGSAGGRRGYGYRYDQASHEHMRSVHDAEQKAYKQMMTMHKAYRGAMIGDSDRLAEQCSDFLGPARRQPEPCHTGYGYKYDKESYEHMRNVHNAEERAYKEMKAVHQADEKAFKAQLEAEKKAYEEEKKRYEGCMSAEEKAAQDARAAQLSVVKQDQEMEAKQADLYCLGGRGHYSGARTFGSGHAAMEQKRYEECLALQNKAAHDAHAAQQEMLKKEHEMMTQRGAELAGYGYAGYPTSPFGHDAGYAPYGASSPAAYSNLYHGSPARYRY